MKRDSMTIPFEIRRVKNPDATTSFIAVVSVTDAIKEGQTKNILPELQKKYFDLIKRCKDQIKIIQKNRINMADPKQHWILGDLIFSFIDDIEKEGFYFANAIPTLVRDTLLSQRYVTYHIQLRKDYPSINLIDKKVKWWGYQELLDIADRSKRKRFEEKMLKGAIKTRDDLRKFKRKLKTDQI